MFTNGTLFLVVLGVGAFIWMTQAGAKESKLLSSPIACLLFLVVVGSILYFIWYSGSGVVLTH